MGFLGRGRGGIHASSRKSNSDESGGSKRDQHGGSGYRSSRDHSSHSSSRGDGHKKRDRSRSPLKTQYSSKDISATESLRITVGNDIYKEKERSTSTRSPLAGRLGPPVDRSPYEEQSLSRKSDSLNDFDSYSQEAKYYGQGDRGRRDEGRGRSGGYDNDKHRSRDYSKDRHDEDIGYRRQTHGGNRMEDRFLSADNDRRRESSMDKRESSRNRDSLERLSGYREPESDSFFRDDIGHRDDIGRRDDFGRRDDIDRRDDIGRRDDRNLSVDRGSVGSYGKNSPSRDLYQNPPFAAAPAKPLKSILKKKGATPEESAPAGQSMNLAPKDGQNLFPVIRPKLAESADRQTSDDDWAVRSESRGKPKAGLPGMSSYMDIDDEEKFLYGDDEHEKSSKLDSTSRQREAGYGGVDDRRTQPDSYPSRNQSLDDRSCYAGAQRSIDDLYAEDQRSQLRSLHSDDLRRNLDLRLLESRIPDQHIGPTAEEQLRSSVSSFLEDQRLKLSISQEQKLYTTRDTRPVQQEPTFKPDFLSLFTSQKDLSLIPQSTPVMPTVTPAATIPFQPPVPKEEPKPKYDPTIENILKSIGFDFEMSRRMQEKASNSQPVQKPKKEEEEFGVNQTASFLEGGISDDIKSKLFKKEESIVDILIREAKGLPPPRSAERPRPTETSRPTERPHPAETLRPTERPRPAETSHPAERPHPTETLRPAERSRHTEMSRTTERRYEQEEASRDRYKKERTLSSEERRSSYGNDGDKIRVIDRHEKERKSEPEKEKKKEVVPDNPPVESETGNPYGDPALSTESLSSGISFQRQITPTEPPFSTYSQPISQPISYPPQGYPPTMGQYTMAAMPQGPPGSMPPYSGAPMYNQPHPYGYGPPPPQYGPGPYPYNYPPHDQFQPPPDSYPSGSHPITLAPPMQASRPQHPGPPRTDNRTKDTRRKEEIEEKKTITLEKKTITISPKDSTRTVIPPKLDKSRSTLDKDVKPDKKEAPPIILSESRKKALILERTHRREKLGTLELELKKLRTQQNEMMRRIRRQKDGHKDPILIQNNKLLDEVNAQISKERKFLVENSKILKAAAVDLDSPTKPVKKVAPKVNIKEEDRGPSIWKKKKKEPLPREKRYEFFDPGGHWCKVCNTESGSIYSVLQHLHAKKHQQALNPYDRPWVPKEMKSPAKVFNKNDHLAVLPVKGQEFLVPCKALYCTLCKEFAGDEACADFHLKCDAHYQKYLKHLEMNEFYEQRLGLDRAAGQNGKTVKPMKKEEKNEQKRQRVQEKEKKWEKPVDELLDGELPTSAKKVKMSPNDTKGSKVPKIGADGFGKFTFSSKDGKNDDGKNEPPKQEDEKSSEEQKDTGETNNDSKSKIAINIVNKIGIKPITGAKILKKKNPLLPPWTPVAKQDAQKQAAGASKAEVFPLRKAAKKTETAGGGMPAALDMFLTIEDKSKPLPVMKDGKPKVTAQDILKAFTGKLKDENSGSDNKKEKNSGPDRKTSADSQNPSDTDAEKTVTIEQKEELEDMKMMGIDPNSEKPLAMKRPPPPPSQNLSLPTHLEKETGDEAATKKTGDGVQKNTTGGGNKSIKSDPEPSIGMDIPLPPTDQTKTPNTGKESSSISMPVPMDLADILLPPPKAAVGEPVKPEVAEAVPTNDVNSSVAESENEDDAASECSDFSMHMGSDFEVVDECEADET